MDQKYVANEILSSFAEDFSGWPVGSKSVLEISWITKKHGDEFLDATAHGENTFE